MTGRDTQDRPEDARGPGQDRPVRGRRRGARIRRTGAGLTLAALALTGCMQVPTSSPVATSPPLSADAGEEEVPLYLPPGPNRGASVNEVIRGFLSAGVGPQEDFAVARDYLTEDAARTWVPGRRTVVYSSPPTITATQDEGVHVVQVEVTSTVDENGVRTMAAPGTTEAVEVTVTEVDGEVRIAEVPDGTLLSQSQFTSIYAPQHLYYFDPTMTFAVPDIRWFVNRGTAANDVVRTLLQGPAAPLAGAVVSAFPAGAASGLARPSVPVEDGVARVDLAASTVEGADTARLAAMQRQLELSLGGLSSVERVEVTVGLDPLEISAEGTDLEDLVVDPASGSVQIAVDAATQRPVFVQGLTVSPVGGLTDISALNPVDPTMNRSRTVVAFLTADRRALYTADTEGRLSRALEGRALTAPTTDGHGWVWAADELDGSEVRAVPGSAVQEQSTRVISTPWTNSERVIRSMQMSPDGTRVALLTSDGAEARLHVAGVVRGADGVPTALTAAAEVLTDVPMEQVVWADATTLLVAGQATESTQEITPQLVSLDGTRRTLTPLSGLVNITAGGTSTFYAETEDDVYLLVGSSWRSQELPRRVRELAFAG